MGQSCSGAEREAYLRREEARVQEEQAQRPHIVEQGAEEEEPPPSIDDMQSSKAAAPRRSILGVFPDATPTGRSGSPPTANVLLNPYGAALAVRRTRDEALTTPSGAFRDPANVDRFFDVCVSHLLRVASAEGGGGDDAVRFAQAKPTWDSIRAIPYPSATNLPPVPFSSHGVSTAVDDGLLDPFRSATSSAFPSAAMSSFDTASYPLQWKPRFSRSVSAIERAEKEAAQGGRADSAEERAARKAARAMRRKEREERLRQEQVQAMAAFSHNAVSPAPLNYSYTAAEEEEDEPNPPVPITHSRASLQPAASTPSAAPVASPSALSPTYSYDHSDFAAFMQHQQQAVAAPSNAASPHAAAARSGAPSAPPAAARPASSSHVRDPQSLDSFVDPDFDAEDE